MTNQSRRTLIVNEYGKRKAERFRARFGLSTFNGSDVHDYLHTVIGASISLDDEKRVLALESAIECGEVPLPRGIGSCAMTNLSPDEQAQLNAALDRIVDERGDGNDWRCVVDARKELGNEVVMAMAKDAADRLRASRGS